MSYTARVKFTWTVPACVIRVIDADTLVLDLDIGWGLHKPQAHCRLLGIELGQEVGIDAYERNTPKGKDAQDFVRRLLPLGTEVIFRSRELDKYGRSLGTVQLPDGTDLGQLLLAAGHAVPMPAS